MSVDGAEGILQKADVYPSDSDAFFPSCFMPGGSFLVSLISTPASGFLASITSILMAAAQQILLVSQQVASCSPALLCGSSMNFSTISSGYSAPAPAGSELQPGLEEELFGRVREVFQVAPSWVLSLLLWLGLLSTLVIPVVFRI